jgi:AmmeMemoRadiSam system protein A/AmmeMemoRadiSam system protein B
MSVKMAFIVPHPPLIVPDIGRGEEKKIQSTVAAYDSIARMTAQIKPETIIVASPHSIMYGDYIHISPGEGAEGNFGRFGAAQVSIRKAYDVELVAELCAGAERAGIPAGVLGQKDKSLDHGVLVPLYFIEKYWRDCKLVRLSISGLSALDHYRFGQCVAAAVEKSGRNAVFIGSGDLSHKLTSDGPYGFAKEGPEFDREITDAMRSADFYKLLSFNEEYCEAAAECGLRSFIEMAGVLDGKALKTDFLSYEGPFGVGYAVCAYTVTGDDDSRRFARKYETEQERSLAEIKSAEDGYVKLARLSLETYVRSGDYARLPAGLPDDMLKNKAGVFVSLKKDGRLRGCIGTISPAEPSIAEEIIRNAVSAGTGDPRFEPVEEDELESLVYSVDVLGEAEPIASMNELDAKRYGVIVTKGSRRGLLLPNLEGVNTPRQQVAIALQKAGIPEGEKYGLERFEVVRHK